MFENYVSNIVMWSGCCIRICYIPGYCSIELQLQMGPLFLGPVAQ